MSFRGMLIKAGIDSNGTDIAIFNGYLKLQRDNILYFRNTNTYIYSGDDGWLTLYASNGFIFDTGEILVEGDVAFDGGFACHGDVVDAFVIDGTESDNGIEITGVAQGSGIDIDYTLPLEASRAINIDVDSSMSAGDCTVVSIRDTNGAAGMVNWRTFTVDQIMAYGCSGPYAAYFRTDCGTSQVLGLGAAFGMELVLPGAILASGEFHGMTIDIECPENFSTGLGKHSFIKMETWGDAAAKIVFDDAFNMFFVNGPAAGVGNLISLTSQTARVNINNLTRYLVMSQMQDGLGLGVTGTPMVLAAAANHAIDVWVTTPATTGAVWAAAIDLAYSGAGGANIGGLTTTLDIDANHGGFAIGHFVTLTYSATHDAVGGIGIAGCFEITLPGKLAGGEYHVLALELAEAGVGYLSSSALGSPTSFIKFETYGDAHDELDDHAYLFYVNGFTAAADHMLSANSQTLRVDIEEAARFLVLSQTQDCLSLSGGATPIVLAAAGAATTCIGMTGILAGTNSRAIGCFVTQNNAAHTDGYGCNEFDVTLTGTSTSHVAAVSSWINITAAGTHGGGGDYINALSLGVYIGATPAIGAARVNFGFRASYQGGQTPGNLHLISYSSPGVDITSMFHIGQFHSNVGCVAAAGSATEPSTCVKFMSDDGGNVKYIRLYDDVN